MKKAITIALIAATSFLIARTTTTSLGQAVSQGYVRAKFNSLGGHQGYCINLQLTNLRDDSLIVTVEAGRRLNSLNDDRQDILLVKEERIALKRHEVRYVALKGYCCEASKAGPHVRDSYNMEAKADLNLAQMGRFLSTRQFGDETAQQAVWAVSDRHATAAIAALAAADDTAALQLRRFTAILKHEPLPWYTLVTTRYTYASGYTQVFPQLLKATLLYTSEAESYASCRVVDQNGTFVCSMRDGWLKGGKDQPFEVELPVKGLKNGKYTLELCTSGKMLVRREFEI